MLIDSQSERISRRGEEEVTVAGLSKALASLIQAFKDVFRVGKRASLKQEQRTKPPIGPRLAGV